MERCIASNKTLAVVAGCEFPTVPNAIMRLKKYGYIEVRVDSQNHREEIIPLVSFANNNYPSSNNEPHSSNNEGGIIQMTKGPSSNDEHNKNIEKEELNNILVPSGRPMPGLLTEGRSPEKAPALNKRLANTIGDKYLLAIPPEDMAEFLSTFTYLDKPTIEAEARKAYDWHQEVKKGGAPKKDFKGFIKRWIAKTNASKSVQRKRGGVATMGA